MLKISYDTTQNTRAYVLNLVKDFRVINIGGAYNDWANEVSDITVDLHSVPSFDICEKNDWKYLLKTQGKFNYAICNHILEDVHNPYLALEWLPKIAERGIITMPSLQTELSRIEGLGWIGYCHHRFLFDQKDDKMFIAPKLSILESFVKNTIPFMPEKAEIRFEWDNNIPYTRMIREIKKPGWGPMLLAYEKMFWKVGRKNIII